MIKGMFIGFSEKQLEIRGVNVYVCIKASSE